MWSRRDAGAWSLPKGEYEDGEDPLAAAVREFAEELGSPLGPCEPVALGEVQLRSGKRVIAWAVEGDLDTATVRSNTCEVEWPPRSGRLIEVPEIDRAEWFSLAEARLRLNPAQVAFIDRLEAALTVAPDIAGRS